MRDEEGPGRLSSLIPRPSSLMSSRARRRDSASMQPPPRVPRTRLSGRKRARAPAFCGVEPEVWTTVARANGRCSFRRATISLKNCSGRWSVIDAPEAVPAADTFPLADKAIIGANHAHRLAAPVIGVRSRAGRAGPIVVLFIIHLLGAKVQTRLEVE